MSTACQDGQKATELMTNVLLNYFMKIPNAEKKHIYYFYINVMSLRLFFVSLRLFFACVCPSIHGPVTLKMRCCQAHL